MLKRDLRVAILELHRKGHGLRAIARAIKVSRLTVRKVLEQGTPEPPVPARPELLMSELDLVRDLFGQCKGNIVRVHEELLARNVHVGYATLTAFCRRHQIGVQPKLPVGSYVFDPAEEMQHDTSPHRVLIADHPRLVHCASLVLCYSRMIYAQVYPRWNRFWCKVFLTEGCRYFKGSAKQCMLDNSSVIIAQGSGADAIPAPEMAALATFFGFEFVAHKVGDANRSARVERPFDYIEKNFYPGRQFADVADLNRQLREWCDRANAKHKRSLKASPRELFAIEQSVLQPLPLHIPEPTEVHFRVVDSLGYVTVHTNNYSVPCSLLDRSVDVLATKDRIQIFDGHHFVCQHLREQDGAQRRCTLPEHRDERRMLRSVKAPPSRQEQTLRAVAPELAELVRELKSRHRGRAVRPLRRLHQMYLDYPTDTLCTAIRRALDHRLYDLERIESIVLSQLTGNFFREPAPEPQKQPSTDVSPSHDDLSQRQGKDLDDDSKEGTAQ